LFPNYPRSPFFSSMSSLSLLSAAPLFPFIPRRPPFSPLFVIELPHPASAGSRPPTDFRFCEIDTLLSTTPPSPLFCGVVCPSTRRIPLTFYCFFRFLVTQAGSSLRQLPAPPPARGGLPPSLRKFPWSNRATPFFSAEGTLVLFCSTFTFFLPPSSDILPR